MVVAALIFVLGIDLVKQASWDTKRRVSRQALQRAMRLVLTWRQDRTEYITIISIMITMTVWDSLGCGSVRESATVVGRQGRRARILWCLAARGVQGANERGRIGAAVCGTV